MLLVGLAIWSASGLRVNYLFENFFPKDDPDYIAYKDFRENFTNDDRFVQVAFQVDHGIFNPNALEKIKSIETATLTLDHVIEIKSLLSLRIPVKTPLGWISNPILRQNPETLAEDSISIMENAALSGNFISEDGRFYCIHLKLEDSTTDRQNRKLVESIELLMQEEGVVNYHMGGFINTQVNYVRLLEGEFPTAAATSAISMCLILLLLYRSYQNALLPTMTVILSLVLFFGYLGVIGRDLNITSTLFITIMTIVAVSDIVHLQTYYHRFLLKGLPKGEAINKALGETYVNLFLTSLTTAIGFFTFFTSSIPHIRTFGMDAGVGVLMAFLITVTLGPVLLYFFPPSATRIERDKSSKFWEKMLHGVYGQGKRNKPLIWLVTLLVICISIWGITKIDNNQYLAGNFDDSTQLKKDFNFFEAQLGGVRALEMHFIPQNNLKITDLPILESMQALEEELQNYEFIGTPISPVSWMKTQSLSVNGGRLTAFKLPEDQETVDYLILNDRNRTRKTVISEGDQSGRLLVKMHDIGSEQAAELHENLYAWIDRTIDPNLLKVQITGSALLIDKNNENVFMEMIYSLALAFVCISILMALLFRRWKMVLISIFPNMLPLIAVGGLMGWLGIPLNAATSLIFTIGFVIAIDDTIHFLVRFRKEYADRKSLEYSIKHTLASTGKAILFTTIILLVVYTASAFSNFKEISQHAILVSATLIFALIGDFYLLPTLLRHAARKKDLF